MTNCSAHDICDKRKQEKIQPMVCRTTLKRTTNFSTNTSYPKQVSQEDHLNIHWQ